MSWPLSCIGDCVERVATWNPSKSETQDPFIYIDLSAVDKDKKVVNRNSITEVTPNEAPSRARQLVRSRDVLVATVRPNLNGVAIVPEEYEGATASTGYCVLRADGTILDSQYLYYWVQTKTFVADMMEKAAGANYPAVSDKIIKESKIPLPPLSEQKRIAAILDKADAIRRKRQQAIQLADEFLRAVFLDMFGDPATNPKGLVKTRIGDLCEVVTGSTPSRKVESYYGGYIPWVKTTEVDGYVINKTEECITREGLNNSNCKINPIGSIVLAMYGQGKTRGKVGMLGIEAATNQACAVIKPSSAVMMEYLYIYLQLSYDSIRSLGQGAGQPNLNLSIVKDFPVPLPNEELQREFVRVSKIINDIKEKNIDYFSKSSGFFSALSQKAFSGEL